MFTWICPKCGKEVPPAYSECPNCAATDQPAAPPEAAAEAPAPAPEEAPPRSAPRTVQRHILPLWLVSLNIAALFIIAGVTFLVIHARKRPEPTPSPDAALETPTQPSAASEASPILRNLELTGFRLTEDSKLRVILQCVVINHSGADLGDVSAKASLNAITASQALEPVGTFAFRTTLGPYESKDLKVPVTTKMRAYELPDWQFLRAEITGP